MNWLNMSMKSGPTSYFVIVWPQIMFVKNTYKTKILSKLLKELGTLVSVMNGCFLVFEVIFRA